MQLDALDQIAAKAFDGFIVRKDLVRRFKGQYPVPTYVGEFLLGRYCSSTDEGEIQEGLEIVQRQLESRTVRAGEEELFKARAKEQGRVKLIDLITARLDARNNCFVAELPSLRIKDVRIGDELVHAHERMLTGGFYAEVDLEYDPSIAEEKNGRPFGIDSLREIQLSKRDALDTMARGRQLFTFARVAGLPAAQHRPGAREPDAAHPRRDAAAHGPLRREQLQRGGAGPAGDRQEPSLPAGLALRASGLRRQGDGGPDVRQQRHRPARPGLPVRRGLLR